MRALQILLFILALFPIAILIHDGYSYYETIQEEPNEKFTFSELGFLWYTYEPTSHDMAKSEVGSEEWEETVKPVLRMPAALAAAIPPAIVVAIMGLLWLFGGWPFDSLKRVPGKVSRSDFAATTHGEKKFTYKRK